MKRTVADAVVGGIAGTTLPCTVTASVAVSLIVTVHVPSAAVRHEETPPPKVALPPTVKSTVAPPAPSRPG